MSTYAIVESGGKQYRVEEGQSLLVDRISEDEGAKVGLRAVMFRSDSDTVIAPKDLEKVKVEAKIAAHERGEKIKVFKYKAKKGYRKHQGHRSELTRLEVTEVKLLSRKPAAAKQDDTPPSRRSRGAAEGPARWQKASLRSGRLRRSRLPRSPRAGRKKPAAKKRCRQEPAAKAVEARCAKKPAAKKPAAKKPAAKKETD